MDIQTAMLMVASGGQGGSPPTPDPKFNGTIDSTLGGVLAIGQTPTALIAHKTEPYLYIGLNTDPQGIQIIDISDPSNMVNLGRVTAGTPYKCKELIISHDGNYLFAINQPGADSEGCVDVYDIFGNPSIPNHIMTNTNLYYKYHASAAIHPTEDYIYTGGGNSRLNVVNISNPTQALPRTLKTALPDPDNQMTCSAYGLFYADEGVAGRIRNLDISDATNPVARASTNSVCQNTVIARDQYYYTMSPDYGVMVHDATDIDNIVLVGSDVTNKADIGVGLFTKMRIADDILFQPNGADSLCTADVSDPANPVFLGKQTLSTTYFSTANLIAIVGENAFVTNYTNNTLAAIKLGTT